MIVTDDRVLRFVSEQLNTSFCPPFTALGIERDGEIIAGVIFNVFEKPDLHISVAGHGWTRAFFRAVGAYVFGQLGYSRMTALTESAEVVRLAERIGGEIEGCLRSHYGPGRDGFIVGILAGEYKFR